MTRRCKECKKEFTQTKKSRRFCCDKCRNKHWVKEHPRFILKNESIE